MADRFFEKVGTEIRTPETPTVPEPAAAGGVMAPTEDGDRYQRFFGEKRWAANHDTFWGAASTYDELPAGNYRCSFSSNVGYVLEKQYVSVDHLLVLPDQATNDILAEFDTFWAREAEFAKREFVFKRGFLLWGPPGGGKTSTVQLLVQKLVKERKGVVLYVDRPDIAAGCLQLARSIEKTRPLICIMEDFDALVQQHGENNFLAMLDGEAQVDKIVFLACPAPETLILKADLTWARADSLVEGEQLIAFDENGPDRKYRTTTVRSCPLVERKRWRLATDDGSTIVVSEDHPFLVQLGNRPHEWRKVQDLNPGNRILSIGRPWETEATREGGYLAGQFDGEGSLSITYNADTGSRGFRARWVQASGDVAENVERLLLERNFQVNRYDRTPADRNGTSYKPQTLLDIGGGRWGSLRLLGMIRPDRLLAHPNLREAWEGARLACLQTKVVSVEPWADGPVVALDTTTGTFIGEGLLQHNTTNYPERLDRRFVDRPSRFDTIKEIGMPTAAARRVYLEAKEESLSGAERDRWVALSEDFSIAHLKELIIGVKCLGQPLEDVVVRLREMMETRPKSGNGADRPEAGFVGGMRVRWTRGAVAAS